FATVTCCVAAARASLPPWKIASWTARPPASARSARKKANTRPMRLSTRLALIGSRRRGGGRRGRRGGRRLRLGGGRRGGLLGARRRRLAGRRRRGRCRRERGSRRTRGRDAGRRHGTRAARVRGTERLDGTQSGG